MRESAEYKIPVDYYIFALICLSFIAIAFALEPPLQVLNNYIVINTSRSVLVSDYVAMAGVGAALLNSAISVLFFLVLLVYNKCEPNGKIFAALFLTMGFSLFGKNMFNSIPICIGVWLYAKSTNAKFSNYVAQAMFSTTVAPIVSEIAFVDGTTTLIRVISAYGVGVFIGLIFPAVVESAKRMHRGYNLYNSGVAGGLIATFFVGLLRSAGIYTQPENLWDTSNTVFLAKVAFAMAILLIIYGIIADRPANAYRKLKLLSSEKDVNHIDYFTTYGSTCYINIGILCIVSTVAMLLIGIPINGPVLGGILTVAGFAAFGKHLVNTVPILLGSILAAHVNYIEVDAATNSLAILFSTGLAPMSGKYGWKCGILIGFLHVSVSLSVGHLNGWLNLYNNGFAGGFVVITIAPILLYFKEIYANYRNKDTEIKPDYSDS